MKNEINNTLLGFDSVSDFVTTLFNWKYKFSILIASFFGGLTSFITSYIYNDAHSVYLLFSMMIADVLTAWYRAVKSKTFSSKRLPRVLVVLTCYVTLLSFSWHISIISNLYSWLPGFVYLGMVTTVFISIVENLIQSGIIKGTFWQELLNRLKFKNDAGKNEK